MTTAVHKLQDKSINHDADPIKYINHTTKKKIIEDYMFKL